LSPTTTAVASANRILASIPPRELERLAEHLNEHRLEHGETLIHPWEPITQLVFPTSCVLSVVRETVEGRSVEVATVGKEGMVGADAFIGGAVSPLRTLCQIGGSALVGRVEDLVEEDGDSVFRASVLRYSHTMLVQAAITAACNRLHPLEQRAARWLLTMSDRVDRSAFDLTHELFAVMLGAHRPSVSLAAQMLQQAGLIRYRRGHIEILDRPGLIAAACDCYTITVEHFERTMGIRLGEALGG
jgi:CRP-like cAMP-binding protein